MRLNTYHKHMLLFFSFLLAIVTLVAVSIQKTYRSVPVYELKRQARRGDEVATLLYRAVSYGPSLQAILWLLVGASAAGFFLVLDHAVPTLLAFLLSVLLIWVGFVWLPSGRVTKVGSFSAAKLAPALAWLLNYLHPLFDRVLGFVRRHRPITVHTGLYEREDLVNLLQRQITQTENRIEKAELDLTLHALTFGDRLVRDFITPRRVVRSVPIDEKIGPVLMDELHASGHSRFPVYEGDQERIVGTLYMRDLLKAKEGGAVRDAMRKDVCYVHENQPLWDALQGILKTRHHLLVVVNSFEEYVGIITAEDVIEQIIGRPILDEFDQYDDMRAVAARVARVEHKDHTKQEVVATKTVETVVESE